MKVIKKYPTYQHEMNYEMSDYFCPGCGVRSLWEEQSAGDYYVGPNFNCSNCFASFTLQSGGSDKEIGEQLPCATGKQSYQFKADGKELDLKNP